MSLLSGWKARNDMAKQKKENAVGKIVGGVVAFLILVIVLVYAVATFMAWN